MTLESKTLSELVNLVFQTYEIDESGDARLEYYLKEEIDNLPSDTTMRQVLIGFLIWANGSQGIPNVSDQT